MKRIPLVRVVDRLENATLLDPLAKQARRIVGAALRPRWLRDILHGVPLGHPVHPLAVQVPLGTWVSAAVLDAVPGTHRASQTLVGVGVVSALPSAVAGYADWSRLHEQQQRVGLVHSAANLIATGLYAASFIQRSRGKHTSGKVLGYVGLAVATSGGLLGGHLTYRQAAGVNHTEDVPHLFPQGWHPMGPLDQIAEGRLQQRTVEGTTLLVFRRGDRLSVLADTCSHLSAPLHEGAIVDGPRGSADVGPCVECPWHQSVFSLETGEVVHGPATSAQPKFSTRVNYGIVEVCLWGAG